MSFVLRTDPVQLRANSCIRCVWRRP